MSEVYGPTIVRSRGFYVDVGERDLFYVELDDVETYERIHESRSSMLVRALLRDGERAVVRVSWSKYKRVAQGRGYSGMLKCRSLAYVPDMYSRELHTIGSTYIEVTTRQYIDGCTLSEAWESMLQAQKDSIAIQVENVVCDMSAITSTHFAELQGRNLSTRSPVQFINYRILLSMITGELEEGDMRVLDMQDFDHTPVLCHNELSMDHIIVDGGKVVGIVGWSKCDFVPEIVSRMQYQFRKPLLEGEQHWYNFLSKMDLFHPPPPPLYVACCMYHNYYLRLNSSPQCHHNYLERRLADISDVVILSVRRTYMGFDVSAGCVDGDRRSRPEHTRRSPATENPFDAATEISSSRVSISSWECLDDTETVLDILDKLSVV